VILRANGCDSYFEVRYINIFTNMLHVFAYKSLYIVKQHTPPAIYLSLEFGKMILSEISNIT